MSDAALEASAEEAVRRYLLFLDDPTKLRDEAEVQRRTVAVLEANDPIEKLRALTALEEASAIDEQALRDAFVAHAGRWAEANGISVQAFLQLNVPADLLSAAGFEVPTRRARRATPNPIETAATPTTTRRPSVSTTEIKDAVLTFVEPFTLNEVMAKVGGSPMTVRKAIDDLIAAGQVEKRGTVPGYKGRGRAPIQYALVSMGPLPADRNTGS
jgi:hypothetical protein